MRQTWRYMKRDADKIREWQQRTRKPLKKTPLRRVSKKREKQNKEYYAERKDYLERHPTCTVCKLSPATDIHHTRGRFHDRLTDFYHCIGVCRPCHQKIHANPTWAREKGYLE